MYGLGVGISTVSEILTYELGGVGHTPGDPRLVSLNASYHKEQEWYRGRVSEILGLS